ncbi:MAG: LamG domain-containing protein [Verrucomicrobia bacterium]|nr:LamG domain-containing protein [Verrucomicrobiota bacterium]
MNNLGTAHNLVLADGRAGRQALRFNGDGYIEVAKSPSLNPARSAWTVEVAAKPEKPDGVLLARGGKSQGFALWLKAGRPAFTVVVANQPVTVEAREPLTDWATLSGMITAEHHIQLRVNNQLAADAPLPDFIGRDPADVMQIGADLGSPVVEPVPPKFTGLIESVRIFSGEQKP